jgi:hypothetical protein
MGTSIWRYVHRFVLWSPFAFASLYIASIAALAAASTDAGDSRAQRWLDAQFDGLEAALNTPDTVYWAMGIAAVWLLGLLVSGHLARERPPVRANGASGSITPKSLPITKGGGSESPSDELDYWTNVDDMKLWEAAYLWIGCTPPKQLPADTPPQVKAQMHRMQRALGRGELVPKAGLSDDAHPALRLLDRYVGNSVYADVERSSLQAYAEKVGQQPSFLYPTTTSASRTI